MPSTVWQHLTQHIDLRGVRNAVSFRTEQGGGIGGDQLMVFWPSSLLDLGPFPSGSAAPRLLFLYVVLVCASKWS